MMEKPKFTNKMAEVAADVPMPPVPGNLVPGAPFTCQRRRLHDREPDRSLPGHP